jgi:pimeloyl-ACP methyl ester carboxylesterase
LPSRYVVFSHGKDSGPWGKKIIALTETAKAEGYTVESIDYRGIDSPEKRVERLVEGCRSLQGELVLVGSSLGGFVSMAAASFLHARGVFLMAPALYMPGLPELRQRVVDCPVEIVHGWKDDVVPLEHSMRFAREYGAALHVLEDDHGLHRSIRRIKHLFEFFLVSIDLPPEMT